MTSTPSALRRTTQLLVGLFGYALSMALLLHAGQGGMPWDVLHQGVVRRTGLPFGVVVVVASVLVLLAWVPLRQRPGIGTVANVVVIGASVDPFLALLERAQPAPGVVTQVLLALSGIALNGLATAAYIGSCLGPGPRDGLMTGLVARTGYPVRAVRTAIEIAVVLAGWALGGTFGWATVAYALGVGPIVQLAARRLAPAMVAPARRAGSPRTGPWVRDRSARQEARPDPEPTVRSR